MTEANVPPTHSSARRPASSNPNAAKPAADAPRLDPATAHLDDWQAVNFPNAISIDAIERQAMYDQGDMPPKLSVVAQRDRPRPLTVLPDLTPAAPDPEEPPPPPNVSDLIAVIQDLNQCNHALLARIDELEQALSADQAGQPEAMAPALQHQLEFAQQTQRRQQVRIDALVADLASSQERIAELERECSLAQQRYQSQTQQLVEADTLCRDLRSRLQRQQRYTLQYKVALEKSLDVPPPSYLEDSEDAIAAAPPSSSGIRPWSASGGELRLSKLDDRLQAALRDAAVILEQTVEPDGPTAERPVAPALPSEAVDPGPAIAPPEGDMPPNLTGVAAPQMPQRDRPVPPDSAVPPLDPALLEQLDAAVQPLLESVMEAIKAEQLPVMTDPLGPEAGPLEELEEKDLGDGLEARLPGDALETGDPTAPAISPDAEESLWQDLARLVDISTDDVVQASLAGNFDAFSAINYDAVPRQAGQAAPDAPVTASQPPAPRKKRTSLAAVDLPSFPRLSS
jgi:hypothetical protein